MRKGTFHQLHAGVERARIVARHCIHPSRVRSGLRMTRTAPVDPLSHSVGSRVKPLFVAWTISMDSIMPAIFATGAECVKWSTDSLAGPSKKKFCAQGELSGCGSIWMRTLQNTRSPVPKPFSGVWMRRRSLQTLVSTPTISEFHWILRGVDLQCQPSHVAVETSSRNFNDCSRTVSRFRPGRVPRSCCHHINNCCVRFSERQPGVR